MWSQYEIMFLALIKYFNIRIRITQFSPALIMIITGISFHHFILSSSARTIHLLCDPMIIIE